jgi:hypothetical protein
VALISTRRARIPFTIADASSADGAPVDGETTSTPRYSPTPRTSASTGLPAARSVTADVRYSPVTTALPGSSSSASTSSTADAAATQTGFPPKVLKYRARAPKSASTDCLATSPAIGSPFPIGLPIVTMSGVRPRCRWYPQRCDPVRPNPDCTSSAM